MELLEGEEPIVKIKEVVDPIIQNGREGRKFVWSLIMILISVITMLFVLVQTNGNKVGFSDVALIGLSIVGCIHYLNQIYKTF